MNSRQCNGNLHLIEIRRGYGQPDIPHHIRHCCADLLPLLITWIKYNYQRMTADDAHQEAYQHVLPKLKRNIM